VFQRDSESWQGKVDQLAYKVHQLSKAMEGWTLEYVKERLEASLLVFEKTTATGDYLGCSAWCPGLALLLNMP
jgi:hypothetical protein